jgi:HEAT repeat protein
MSRAVPRALVAGFLLTALAAAQELAETRFHRVYLKNGNFIDGALIKKTDREVVLRVKAGEMSIRLDLVDRVEFMTLRTLNQPPKEEPTRKPAAPTKPTPAVDKPPDEPRREPSERPAPAERLAGMRKPEQLYVADAPVRAKVDPIVERMATGTPTDRHAGAEDLVKAGGGVAAYVASLLESVDRDVAASLVNALVRLREPQALPVMAKLTSSPSAYIREQAAVVTGATAVSESSPMLFPLLEDPEMRVRAAAVGALRTLGDARAFNKVAGLLGDPEREVRSRAAEAVTELAKRNGMEREVVPAFRAALTNAQGAARADILLALSHVREVSIWRDLADYLSDDSPEIRSAAAEGLARTGATEAAGRIITQMGREDNKKVRLALMNAVLKLTAVQAVPELVRWLEDPDADIRSAALRTLRVMTRQNLAGDRALWTEWWEKNRPK